MHEIKISFIDALNFFSTLSWTSQMVCTAFHRQNRKPVTLNTIANSFLERRNSLHLENVCQLPDHAFLDVSRRPGMVVFRPRILLAVLHRVDYRNDLHFRTD